MFSHLSIHPFIHTNLLIIIPHPTHPYSNLSVGKQIVDIPSFVVRLDSQKHIDFALTSPYGGGRPGRVKRKRAKSGSGDAAEEDEE